MTTKKISRGTRKRGLRSKSLPPSRPGVKRRSGLFKGLTRWFGFIILSGCVLGTLALGVYLVYLDEVIRTQFEGKRWALPARVYARPLELYPGMALNAADFERELQLLRYRHLAQPFGPGTYARRGQTFEVFLRGFSFWDGNESSRSVRVRFEDQSLVELVSLSSSESFGLVRLEPLEIAGIYPAHREDRILVKREEIPPVLVDSLIAMEDHDFYHHIGIDPRGIVRALIANLKARRTVQGGSTLTQQLVKNFFLTNERTLKRKVTEALMAILVDWRYSKDEILEAYSNEVYMGQDGNRAIHGLGSASLFYFGRPLAELDLHHIALLVGLINGPSRYDPRRYAERAIARRGLVLNVMARQHLISAEDADIGEQMPLDIVPKGATNVTRYPAFMDLVQRQLQTDYRKEDLTSEGLRIFTTLDPQVQSATEQAIQERLPQLEKDVAEAKELQAAAVVTQTQTGDVLATVGGRDVRLDGFNRALDARRLGGSLIKPAIYLTALEYPMLYTVATLLDDSKPVVYTDRNTGKQWSPSNYDKRYHGWVLLQDALARSYNVPTARLGLDLDVIQVVNTLHRLGIERDLRPLPSLLLGAVALSPLEVAQMYSTFASGGFRVPLRAIRAVTATNGETLQRYPLSVKNVIEPGPAYLINQAMQRVAQVGTARAIQQRLDPALGIAGKTGTTNDFRDSWFAGFSGNRLSVVWLGRDDNKSIGLSGSQGALRVWMDVMANLNLEPLKLVPPSDIETALIDPKTGLLADRSCAGAETLPFLKGSVPRLLAPCNTRSRDRYGFRPGLYNPSDGRYPAQPQTGNLGNYPRADQNSRAQPQADPSRRSQNPIGDFFRRLLD